MENRWLRISLNRNTALVSHWNICWIYFWPMGPFGGLFFSRGASLTADAVAPSPRSWAGAKAALSLGLLQCWGSLRSRRGALPYAPGAPRWLEVTVLVIHPLHHGPLDSNMLNLPRQRISCSHSWLSWLEKRTYSFVIYVFICLRDKHLLSAWEQGRRQNKNSRTKTNEDPFPSWGTVSRTVQETDGQTPSHSNRRGRGTLDTVTRPRKG